MIYIPLEIGDIILAGRFKNKKIIVKEISTDEYGNPTVNGRSILKIRIPKLYQDIKMKNLKEATSPTQLKNIDKKIAWGTEKQLPFSQGYAIKTVITQYNIPAIKWGYGGAFIGVETNKQKIFWKDKGSDLEFLGILNKDGSVAENKTLKESHVESAEVKTTIKKEAGKFNIYVGDTETPLNKFPYETEEQAEIAALYRGFLPDNMKDKKRTYTQPKNEKIPSILDKKPEEMKLDKGGLVKLENYIKKIVKEERRRLIEVDVSSDEDLTEKAKRYAELANKMKILQAQLKEMEAEYDVLDTEFRTMVETVGKAKDTFVRAGNILIKIERAAYDANSPKYKEGFTWLHERVNGTMKQLADEAMAMVSGTKTIRSKISVVVTGENKINESKITDFIKKVGNWFKTKLKSLTTKTSDANKTLDKLESYFK